MSSAVMDERTLSLPLAVGDAPFLADHLINDRVVLPAVWALELMARQAQPWLSDRCWLARTCDFPRPLVLGPEPATVQCRLQRFEHGVQAELYTHKVAGRIRRKLIHARALLLVARPSIAVPEPLPALHGEPQELSRRQIYQWIPFGPAFHNVRRLSHDGAATVATLRVEQPWPGRLVAGHGLLRDAGFHVACCHHRFVHGVNAIPTGIAELQMFHPTEPGQDYRCWVQPLEHDAKRSLVRLVFVTDDDVVVEVHDGLRMVAART